MTPFPVGDIPNMDHTLQHRNIKSRSLVKTRLFVNMLKFPSFKPFGLGVVFQESCNGGPITLFEKKKSM